MMKRVAAVLFLSLPVIAAAADPDTFCKGQYALCIKAACRPIVTRNSDGTFAVQEANCLCDVENGWSMGPGSCD